MCFFDKKLVPGIIIEGRNAGEHLEQNRPKRVNIGAMVDGQRLADLLGTHVVHSPDDRSGSGNALLPQNHCNPEIREIVSAVSGRNDVGRFNIPVDDALAVRVRKGRQNLV